MATTPNLENERVAAMKARRDNGDGFDRGSLSPYPKHMEAVILANIAKVSPAFVKGYWEGRHYDEQGEWINQKNDDQ